MKPIRLKYLLFFLLIGIFFPAVFLSEVFTDWFYSTIWPPLIFAIASILIPFWMWNKLASSQQQTPERHCIICSSPNTTYAIFPAGHVACFKHYRLVCVIAIFEGLFLLAIASVAFRSNALGSLPFLLSFALGCYMLLSAIRSLINSRKWI